MTVKIPTAEAEPLLEQLYRLADRNPVHGQAEDYAHALTFFFACCIEPVPGDTDGRHRLNELGHDLLEVLSTVSALYAARPSPGHC
jgi:hypothetical protein